MKTKIKCFVHYQPDQYAAPGAAPVFGVYPFDMSQHGYVLLGTTELEYELPANFNPLQSEIEGLEAQLGKLADEYHRNAAMIRDSISKLQCIENSPAGVA